LHSLPLNGFKAPILGFDLFVTPSNHQSRSHSVAHHQDADLCNTLSVHGSAQNLCCLWQQPNFIKWIRAKLRDEGG
jgi:hypothetical protein